MHPSNTDGHMPCAAHGSHCNKDDPILAQEGPSAGAWGRKTPHRHDVIMATQVLDWEDMEGRLPEEAGFRWALRTGGLDGGVQSTDAPAVGTACAKRASEQQSGEGA